MKKHTYTVTHQQFLRFVVVVTFALAAIILVTCLLYTIVILQRNQTYVDIMLDQYETSVDTQMEEYTQLVQTAAYDASVRNYLQAEEPYARYLAGQEVSTLFSNLKMVQNGVADFYLFERDDPSTAYVDLGAQQSALMERLWQCAKPEVLGIYAYTPSYGQARADFVILAGCPVYSLTVDGPQSRVIGAVVVAINRQAIESNLREFYQLEGMRYALLDQQQRVILGRPLTVSQQDYRLACEQGDVAHNTLTSSTILTSIPAMDAVLVVQSGSLQEVMVNSQVPACKELKRVSSTTDGFLMVQEGKADAAAAYLATARLYAEANPGVTAAEGFRFVQDETTQGTRVGIPKGEEELTEKINEIIDELTESGLYEQWYQEYSDYAASLGIQ